MTDITARIKAKGKNFEILVDMDKALEFKKAGSNLKAHEVLAIETVFSDIRKGFHASEKDLQECFGTTDVNTIAEKIIKNGELVLPIEYRQKEREDKIKQVVDFLSKNAVDPRTGQPHTADRIESALSEAGVNIENKPINQQIPKILEKLRVVLPIKIETKKIKVRIPSMYTGKIYGLIQQYKESEQWLSNGDLECMLNIPAGLQMEFYDKLNNVTHGSAITEEIKEKE